MSATQSYAHSRQQKLVVGFSQTPAPTTGLTRQEIRDLSLKGVKTRAASTAGSGRLHGKVAIITGAGPELAIGTGAARLFAREGAKHIYLLDYNPAPLSRLAEALREKYPNTKASPNPMRHSRSTVDQDGVLDLAVSALVDQAIQEEGHLDVFFANAGIIQRPPKRVGGGGDEIAEELRATGRNMGGIEDTEFMEVLRVNTLRWVEAGSNISYAFKSPIHARPWRAETLGIFGLSVFLGIKYASAAMAKTTSNKTKSVPGGSIILTASVAGLKANAGPIPYSASKAAVISLAQTTAYELAGSNIRVNAICPGLIETDMTRGAFEMARMAGKEGRMGVLNPLLRQGLGVEVAQMALFLASDDSSYVNGQALPVDGGLTASMPYIRPKL
ncbi:hypothetical protein JCM24511_06496 [Saitozyma sp. JCM 24511]|nr:hypothetical protein JCM24511_06496 [Saitozyma sp. JCM 24511]